MASFALSTRNRVIVEKYLKKTISITLRTFDFKNMPEADGLMSFLSETMRDTVLVADLC
jgi:hypothetical protein